MLGSKFVKFLISVFASFFIVMTQNSSVNFKFKYFQLWTKESHESPDFEKFPKLPMLFSEPQNSFSSNFASLSSVMKELLCTFLDQTLHTFHGRNKSKCKFLRLLSARIKTHQILISFETTNQFSFKFCINLQCHETQLLCIFLAEILYTFNKRSLSMYKFDKIESLKFVTLMGSFCQNNVKF